MREAKENHPDLASAAENVKQAKADRDIDLSSMLPQITSDALGKRGRTSSGKTHNTFSYGVTGEQLIFDGFQTSSEVSNSFKTIMAQRYNYAVVSSDIRLNLRTAFVDLLKTQELVSLTEGIAGRRQQNLKLVKLRYEAGREHKGSLLTAEANLAQADFEISQAKRGISLAQRQLTKELGRDAKRQIKAKGQFSLTEDYGFTPDFEYLTDNTPFLRQLAAEKEATRYNLLSKESDLFPKVYLNTSAGRAGTTFVPRDDEWSIGTSVSFPLFEGGSRLAEISKAKSQLRGAKADEKSGRDSVLVTLETTWKDLQDSIENVSVKKKFLEAAEKRAEIAASQYSIGLVAFDDWIIIEDNLVSAKKAYLSAQADMLLTEASWIQAIGGTLEYDEE